MKKKWFNSHTFHHSAFADISALVKVKRDKNVTISVCLPTLNEEKTIAKEIITIKSELQDNYPLIDEIVIVDSNSTDNTREIARENGADVYISNDILPDLEQYKGKGENLWKALYVLKGDIILYLDADIKNIHPKFVYGLVAPLLLMDNIRFCKAFYDRPLDLDNDVVRPSGGGRVTELVTRPLFSFFFPDLTQIMQPLSGEYAVYRELLETIPFPIGYGVETSMILDIYNKWGMDVIAQVDLDKRIHRNQDTKSLGKMSFGILKTFFNRIEKLGIIEINKEVFDTIIQFYSNNGEYTFDMHELPHFERPAMIQISEYMEKFHKKNLKTGDNL